MGINEVMPSSLCVSNAIGHIYVCRAVPAVELTTNWCECRNSVYELRREFAGKISFLAGALSLGA